MCKQSSPRATHPRDGIPLCCTSSVLGYRDASQLHGLPRRPSADESIRKLWYIYTVEYYSAIKKNAFESVLMRWMKLEPIIQSEVKSEIKTPVQYINTYIWNLETQ